MPKDSRRTQSTSYRRRPESQPPTRWIILLPVLVAAVLNLPSLDLGYFWDDFYFLTGSGYGGIRAHLLPEPAATFYRPIPVGIYFKVLGVLDPRSGALGHVLNLAALLGTIVLLVTLVSQLRGPRAGLISGLIFACYGPVASLVAWTSCSQDLFAILFVVAAFLCRHQGKNVAALLCATAGLLCKEPAIAVFPVLILWDWLVGRKAVRPRFQIAGYITVAFLWAVVHPGIHLLAAHRVASGTSGYVGIQHPERWSLYLSRYLMSLFNLPPPGLTTSWWDDRVRYGLAALVILVGGFWCLDRRGEYAGSPSDVPLARMALICALFTIPTVLMPTILVRHWAPYFACIPAVGTSLLLGPVLAKQGKLTAIAVLATFLMLGVWYRGAYAEREPILSERAMDEASHAVRSVRGNFEKLFPTFPKGSQVLVSAGATGIRGIQTALIDGQALSLWYRDPTLRTALTRERRSGAPAEYLVRVSDNLDVLAIDPDSLRVRSAMGASLDLAEIDPPLNTYARAVAAGGDTDRAVRVMNGLSGIESGDLIAYNNRLSASFLLAAGRQRQADSILSSTAPFPQNVARTLVLRLLADASKSEPLDTAAFEAFGLSSTDPETIRWIMLELQKSGSMAQAAWFAEKLGRLAPGDAQSAEVLRRAAAMGVKPRREPLPRLAAHRVEG